MNIAQWLSRSARLHPRRAAIARGTQRWADYDGFARMARRTAGWLEGQGLQPGDRVALFMGNCVEYLPLLWGVWWAGGVAVPVNAKLHEKEAAWIAGHSGSRWVFVDAARREALQAALREAGSAAQARADVAFVHEGPGAAADGVSAGPEPVPRDDADPAWLFYTSGTTGRPKGVTLAARQLREMSLAYLATVQPVGEGDVCLHPAPLSHGSGMYHLPYVMQGGLNVVPASGGFDAQECLDLAAHWQRASFFAAPTIVKRLVDAARARETRPQPRPGLHPNPNPNTGPLPGHDPAGPLSARPTGLATIVYGGGPMYRADIEDALQVIGPHFAQIYGQGECPMTITVLPRALINDPAQPRYRERLASVGVAQPMVEVSVRGADGQALPPGQRGEVCVRGDVVMNGYWNDPAATAAAIRDGWLFTGDVGQMDDDGFLTLLDRSKDLVVSGGSNIYPREVEEALLTHPAVAEVSVIGRPDAEWGEIVVAYVVARTPVDPAALDEHCIQQIARFKKPKQYRFVGELPKNNYGKVLKTVLREWEAGAVG